MADDFIAVSGQLSLQAEGEVRILSASQLNKSGVFTRFLEQVVELDLGNVRVLTRCEALEAGVAIWVPHRTRARVFKLRMSETPFGARYRFICPGTGKQVDKLYLYNGDFCTREELGFQLIPSERFGRSRNDLALAKCIADLLGQSGKGPARGANRERLRAKAISILGSQDALDAQLAAGGYNPRQARKRRDDVPDTMSTQAAISRADYVSPWYIYTASCTAIEGYERDGPPPFTGEILDADFEDIGGFPRLSIDPLVAKWRAQSATLGGGELEGAGATTEPLTLTLRWEEPGLETVWIYGLDLDTDPVLFISFGKASDLPKTVLVLEYGQQAKSKLYALCPVSGARVSHLYWRQKRFASAEAQRLKRPSEMARLRRPT